MHETRPRDKSLRRETTVARVPVTYFRVSDNLSSSTSEEGQDNTIQSIFCCCCCCSVQKRQVRTQISLSKDEELSEKYTQRRRPWFSDLPSKKQSNRGHGQPSKRKPLPPLPPSEVSEEKIHVKALYDFLPREPYDLALKRAEEYLILEKYDPHWWKARDRLGNEGLIPSNYVTENKPTNLEIYEWYHRNITRNQAERLLRQESKEGAFIVRDSRHLGSYTISVFVRDKRDMEATIKHYQIKRNDSGQWYVAERHLFQSIPELIWYHQHNAAGLMSRLRYPVGLMGSCLPATAGFSYEKWEIDPSELAFVKQIGSGQFGVVYLGQWRAHVQVAIKAINEGFMSEEDFIEEAKVMMKLSHSKLVQLYGVCIQQKPLYIVTEFMEHGCLLNYLRERKGKLSKEILLSVCQDICEGMEYLERNCFIHRDLAARNCLVSSTCIVKISDFGMTRYVLDDEYVSSSGAKFPVKWSPPEVFHFNRYSSKSDVWSFGVLMWEVFSEGKMPFENKSNLQVVEAISKGFRLYRPYLAPMSIYEVMYSCWHEKPKGRPTFAELLQVLTEIAETW
ncbi:tyrosine-protein kinase TXK isoform X1 [Bubalus kerabau]|uniref:tyrosine-protein kinase TXK isoform X3 n=1 Tax=Bubalus bubalis TaxID=89462 RepID=UPI001D12717E|nr:tyrosine-protein kinase TXK isoform X3 [Bubalus bubalis]XP_055444473.1 tyrosine-protein kinase TXK isoform X1 [Bubalus carabanensis]